MVGTEGLLRVIRISLKSILRHRLVSHGSQSHFPLPLALSLESCLFLLTSSGFKSFLDLGLDRVIFIAQN